MTQMIELADEQVARIFHETYERLAPSFGYETRQDTRDFDPTTPNGRLMIAVCGEVASALRTPPSTEERQPVSEEVEAEVIRLVECAVKGDNSKVVSRAIIAALSSPSDVVGGG